MARVTIKDVAKKAQVSATTVSKVINKKDAEWGITPETSKRVLEVIRELNYVPSPMARALVSGKTNNIGFIFAHEPEDGGIANPFYAKVLSGVEAVCRQKNYHLQVSTYCPSPDAPTELPHNLRERVIDGAIITTAPDANLINALVSSRCPFVAVGDYAKDSPLSAVLADDVQGGYIATKYLIELGHTRIACFRNLLPSEVVVDRWRGHIKAHEESGLTPVDVSVKCDFTIQGGYDATVELLNSGEEFTALCTFSDSASVGAMRAIREHGLDVPGDISVIGYDGLSMGEGTHPPLTTVACYPEFLGWRAAEKLFEFVNNDKEIPSTVERLPVKLIKRSSCASPTNKVSSGEKVEIKKEVMPELK
jgi:DNA-binding LacI/PurR family transcriptional regulator